jgi:hypothetical protein
MRNKILVCDEEGNVKCEDYEEDPWGGLSFALSHERNSSDDKCPISGFNADEVTAGFLYGTREEAISSWSIRI